MTGPGYLVMKQLLWRYRAAPIVTPLFICALLTLAGCHGVATPGGAPRARSDSVTSFIRVNQIGYLPTGRKVAVVCSLAPATLDSFEVLDAAGKRVFGPAKAVKAGAFGPCMGTYRLDFSALDAEGSYSIAAGNLTSRTFRIAADVYAGAADTLLYYMRAAALGVESAISRFGAHARWEHRGRLGPRRQVHPGERRLGRRVGLPAVRDDVGDRDVHDAHGVPRQPAAFARRVRGERPARR